VECEDDSDMICCPSLDPKTGKQVTLKIDGSVPFYQANLCPPCVAAGTCLDAIQVDNVQSAGDPLSMVVTNVTEYSPVWPVLSGKNDGLLDVNRYGYLYNGKKSDDSFSPDLLQINVCSFRVLKLRTCFKNAQEQPVSMDRMLLRVFDLDHKKQQWKSGPEVIQFKCTGGTFVVYGSHPYISYTAGKPIRIVKDATRNHQTAYTYACPDDQYVTMWSVRGGDAEDNPKNLSHLSPDMEDSTILINYTNVRCVDLIFANMPPRYHQLGWTGPDEDSKGWPFVQSIDGGNPLNSSLEISRDAFPDLSYGPCGPGEGGRNFLMSGKYDKTGTPPCRDAARSSLRRQTALAVPMAVVDQRARHRRSTRDREEIAALTP
jgi:hypothetical protein